MPLLIAFAAIFVVFTAGLKTTLGACLTPLSVFTPTKIQEAGVGLPLLGEGEVAEEPLSLLAGVGAAFSVDDEESEADALSLPDASLPDASLLDASLSVVALAEDELLDAAFSARKSVT